MCFVSGVPPSSCRSVPFSLPVNPPIPPPPSHGYYVCSGGSTTDASLSCVAHCDHGYSGAELQRSRVWNPTSREWSGEECECSRSSTSHAAWVGLAVSILIPFLLRMGSPISLAVRVMWLFIRGCTRTTNTTQVWWVYVCVRQSNHDRPPVCRLWAWAYACFCGTGSNQCEPVCCADQHASPPWQTEVADGVLFGVGSLLTRAVLLVG